MVFMEGCGKLIRNNYIARSECNLERGARNYKVEKTVVGMNVLSKYTGDAQS